MRSLCALLVLCALTGPVSAEPVRMVSQPDGSLIIIYAAPKARHPGEVDTAFYSRVFTETMQRNGWAEHPFADLDRSALPSDRSQRHKWRYREHTGKVEVDPAVPDRPISKEQRRKTVCSKIEQDANAILGLKELCATF